MAAHQTAAAALAALACLIPQHTPLSAQTNVQSGANDALDRLQWREFGPAVMGGRIDDFAVVEKNPDVMFFDPRMTNAGDSFYYPPGLYAKMQGFAGGITESDYQPTAAQGEVAAMYIRDVRVQKDFLDGLMRGDVAAFNERLKGANIPHIGVP